MLTKVFSKNTYKKSLPFYDILGTNEFDDDDINRYFHKDYQFDDDLDFLSSSTSTGKKIVKKVGSIYNSDKGSESEYDEYYEEEEEEKEKEIKDIKEVKKGEITKEEVSISEKSNEVINEKLIKPKKRKKRTTATTYVEYPFEVKDLKNPTPEERKLINNFWAEEQRKLDEYRKKLIEEFKSKKEKKNKQNKNDEKETKEKNEFQRKMLQTPNYEYLYIDDTNNPGPLRKAKDNQLLKGTENDRPTVRIVGEKEFATKNRPESKFLRGDDDEDRLARIRPRRRKHVVCIDNGHKEKMNLAKGFFDENIEVDTELPEARKKGPKKKKVSKKKKPDLFDSDPCSESDDDMVITPKKKKVSKFLF